MQVLFFSIHALLLLLGLALVASSRFNLSVRIFLSVLSEQGGSRSSGFRLDKILFNVDESLLSFDPLRNGGLFYIFALRVCLEKKVNLQYQMGVLMY